MPAVPLLRLDRVGTNFPPSRETTRDRAADEAKPEATIQSLPTGPQRSFLLKETCGTAPRAAAASDRLCLEPIDRRHSACLACRWKRLADGYPFSEQDMGSPPCGAIDPAIDSARAEPSLDRTRRPRRPTRHHHGTVARKAAQHVSELQPCRFKVSSGAGVFREKTGEPAQPKTVLRGAANPGAGLRDQCPSPEAMAFE